jgi:hypothetical protein
MTGTELQEMDPEAEDHVVAVLAAFRIYRLLDPIARCRWHWLAEWAQDEPVSDPRRCCHSVELEQALDERSAGPQQGPTLSLRRLVGLTTAVLPPVLRVTNAHLDCWESAE